MNGISRRDAAKIAGLGTVSATLFTLLSAVAAGLGSLGLSSGPAAAEPTKETGLSFEGLLKDEPGFQPRKPAPQPVVEIPGFLSKAQLARSYKVYRASFDKLLAAENAIQSAPRTPENAEAYHALRNEQVAAANSVLLFEFYFRNLATERIEPSRYVRANMSEHMGTFKTWRADFAACARVAEAWAVLVYDPYDDRWHNLPLDRADAGGMVGTNPLVVCNVSADAWQEDYSDRSAYVSAFLDHIDWDEVASRYRAVDRK